VVALQHQLSLVASDKDDTDVIEDVHLSMAGDASSGSGRLQRRTATSLTSIRSFDKTASTAEKKPLMTNQLIKEEEVEVGAVCHMFAVY